MRKKSDELFFGPAKEERSSSGKGGMRSGIAAICILALLDFAVFGIAAGSWFVFRLSQNLPTISQMQNIEQPLSSKVLDKDGRTVFEFSIEHRILVPIEKIPVDL